MNPIVRDYFTFSKGQQRAIVFLCGMIVFTSLLYFLSPYLFQDRVPIPDNELKQMLAQIQEDSLQQNDYNIATDKFLPSKLTPFEFDPNTLNEAGFQKLGLRNKLITTLLHYREKGGKFYSKESLKRIYGLQDEEYRQLEPFIKIQSPEYSNSFSKKTQPLLSIELNTADTSQLIQLNGIGNKLAANIIKYRTQLGGFASVDQLKEVYGISSETFQKIKPSLTVRPEKIRKLNLNAATLYELNTHPYLRGEIAKALVDCRRAHNYKIENLNQIREIALINEELFRKIAPYLTTQ